MDFEDVRKELRVEKEKYMIMPTFEDVRKELRDNPQGGRCFIRKQNDEKVT